MVLVRGTTVRGTRQLFVAPHLGYYVVSTAAWIERAPSVRYAVRRFSTDKETAPSTSQPELQSIPTEQNLK